VSCLHCGGPGVVKCPPRAEKGVHHRQNVEGMFALIVTPPLNLLRGGKSVTEWITLFTG
jgi:hypothetical protein